MIIKNKFYFFCFINLLIINVSFAQLKETENTLLRRMTVHSVKDYPSGIYPTYEDFFKKIPGEEVSLKIMKMDGLSYKQLDKDEIQDRVFFFQIYNNSKLTSVFAVSFEGNLYIQQKYLSKYAKTGNRNESGDNPNMYHRVLKEGKFFYLEGEFANAWAKGFAYGSGGAVGGVIGASLNKLKGVVFDVENKEFDFIKNCEDFNLFLEENKINEHMDCDKRNIDIVKVRQIIDKIIN